MSTVETIMGGVFLTSLLFAYFVGKDVKAKDMLDGTINKMRKAKENEEEVTGFDSDRLINELSKHRRK